MADKKQEKDFEYILKQFFKDNRYYDSDKLYNAINEKEKEFLKLLNEKQRIEYVNLRAMLDRYTDLLQHDSFSDGFIKGIECNVKS